MFQIISEEIILPPLWNIFMTICFNCVWQCQGEQVENFSLDMLTVQSGFVCPFLCGT